MGAIKMPTALRFVRRRLIQFGLCSQTVSWFRCAGLPSRLSAKVSRRFPAGGERTTLHLRPHSNHSLLLALHLRLRRRQSQRPLAAACGLVIMCPRRAAHSTATHSTDSHAFQRTVAPGSSAIGTRKQPPLPLPSAASAPSMSTTSRTSSPIILSART